MNEEIIELDQSVENVTADEAGLNMAVLLCNQLHADIKHHKEAYQSKVAYLGWQLVRAKEDLPHGEFGKLFKSNKKSAARCAFDFSLRTAQVYMASFKKKYAELKRKKLAEQLTMLLENADADMSALCDFMGEQYPDFVSIRDEQYKATNPFEGVEKKPKEKKDAEVSQEDKRVAANLAVRAVINGVRSCTQDHTLLCADAQDVLELKTALTSMLKKIAGINLN